MKFHIAQYGIRGLCQARVHLGTWTPMKHRAIGPIGTIQQVNAYIRSLRHA
jgi:hypothetical protein